MLLSSSFDNMVLAVRVTPMEGRGLRNMGMPFFSSHLGGHTNS